MNRSALTETRKFRDLKPSNRILTQNQHKVLVPNGVNSKSSSGLEEENKLIKVSQLEVQCDRQSKSILGLEYIIEIIGGLEVTYICSLCDKRCDPRNIISQITSHNHRLKYLVRAQNFDFKHHLINAICFISKISETPFSRSLQKALWL